MLAGMDFDDLTTLGREVERRRLAMGLSVDRAAAKAGINRVTWQRIEAGQRTHDAKRTAALKCLGMLTGQDEIVMSPDAARRAAELMGEDLNPDLAGFTDADLLGELEGRMLHYAAKLDSFGVPSLTWAVDVNGMRTVRSVPGGRAG